MQSIAEKLTELIDNDKDFKELDKILLKALLTEVEKNTKSTGGRLEQTETTQSIVKKSIRSFYNSNAYRKSLQKITAKIQEHGTEKMKTYEIQKLKVNDSLKLQIDEYLSYYSEQGLNEKFNQPLRKIILQNIQSGTSISEMEKTLKTAIEKGEAPTNLGRYVKNTALQASQSYNGIIDQAITDKYQDKITGYKIIGTEIETSSPQCKKWLKMGRDLTLKEIEKEIMPLALKNGFIGEKNDVLKIPTLRLHWGCRHEFIPIIKL
jgi:hypothetical protein